jgi:hypothetical protein
MKTAKEWLEEEGFIQKQKIYEVTGAEWELTTIMERYANYKSKELQAMILNFRMSLKEKMEKSFDDSYFVLFNLLDEFDNHFEITEARNG